MSEPRPTPTTGPFGKEVVLGEATPDPNGLIDDAWERYLMNGTPESLATYVLVGGPIGSIERELIAAHLRGERPLQYPNRADNWRDYKAFVEIEELRNDLLKEDVRLPGKGQTLIMAAIHRYILLKGRLKEEDQGFGAEVNRVFKQYKRGCNVAKKGGPVWDAER